MKKWLIGLFIVLALSVAAVYYFIPADIKISTYITTAATREATFRVLQNDSIWKYSWPGTITNDSQGKNMYSIDDYHFYFNKASVSTLEITIRTKDDTALSILQTLRDFHNSTALEWSTHIVAGQNPLKRIQSYFAAKRIHTIFKKVLAKMELFLSDVKHVYGLDIKKEAVKYQYLMAFKKTLDHYPSTKEIYSMIDEVKQYIKDAGEKEADQPMLNVTSLDTLHKEVQVALPLNTNLPGNNQFTTKKMLLGGEILTAEVKGGNEAIHEAMKICEQYIADYHHSIMAIPFQSLVTNRLNEPDSSKWITVIYYPVVLAQ